MQGFAIVDLQPDAAATAVWLTNHVGGSTVQHTNAVVVDRVDERYVAKIRALTADRIVVLTEGSASAGLFQRAVAVDVFAEFIAETSQRQQLIEKSITDYAARTKNKNLVIPDFPSPPKVPSEVRALPELRALSTANYVAAVWSCWLGTEEQRLRRTTDPRTGTSPWIMPEELSSPHAAVFPPAFAAWVTPEPLTKC